MFSNFQIGVQGAAYTTVIAVILQSAVNTPGSQKVAAITTFADQNLSAKK
ncbi:MAG: hypothetical protein ACI4SR_06125 [Faecalibacillus sp.]